MMRLPRAKPGLVMKSRKRSSNVCCLLHSREVRLRDQKRVDIGRLIRRLVTLQMRGLRRVLHLGSHVRTRRFEDVFSEPTTPFTSDDVILVVRQSLSFKPVIHPKIARGICSQRRSDDCAPCLGVAQKAKLLTHKERATVGLQMAFFATCDFHHKQHIGRKLRQPK